MVKKCSVPRRDFLAQCSAGVAAGGGLIGLPSQSEASLQNSSVNSPTIEEYKNLIGSKFIIEREPGEHLPVELIEVEPGKYPVPARFREPFSLVFRVPKNIRLAQDVYKIKHARLETSRQLLVPIDLPQKYNHLQAVFG